MNQERIVFFLVYRPEQVTSRRPLPRQRKPVSNAYIDLAPLAHQDISGLAARQLPGAISRLTLDLIQQQSKGNPLFIEEFIALLRDEKLLVQDGKGMWSLSQGLFDRLKVAGCIEIVDAEWALKPDAPLADAGLDLSDDLHRLVLSRLDHLPVEDKWILQIASVIGFTFELNLLQACVSDDLSNAQLVSRLENLSALDLLDPNPPGFSFHHPVTQEAVYQGLTDADRRRLHEGAGKAYETLHPGLVETIAYHYGYCAVYDLQNRQTKARDLRPKALHYLELAAARHEARSAYQNALHSAEQALSLYQDDQNLLGQVRCLTLLGLVARRMSRYEDARSYYEQALSLLREVKPEPVNELCKIFNGLGIVFRETSQYPQAEGAIKKALEIAQAGNQLPAQAEALNNLGGTLSYQQLYADALAYHDVALEIRRRIGDRNGEGVSLYNKSLCLAEKGELSRSVEFLQSAFRIQEETGNHWEQANILNGLGIVWQDLGRLAEAQSALERSAKLSQTLGDPAGVCYAMSNLGALQRKQGLVEQAQATLGAGLDLSRRLRDPSLEAYYWSQFSLLWLQRKRYEPGLEAAKKAVKIRRRIGERILTADDLATLGLVFLALERPAEALEPARQAIKLLKKCCGEGPETPPRDYWACYRVFRANQRAMEARAALLSAYDLLMQRAEQITDPEARAYYLDQPDHRQIVADYFVLNPSEPPGLRAV
jgi:tetratricopeptide (TPR) repeat protein